MYGQHICCPIRINLRKNKENFSKITAQLRALGEVSNMVTITRVAEAMQKVLGETADKLGKESQFIKRERKLTGSIFAQTLVFGWLANGNSSLGEMNQSAAAVGIRISEQGIDKRFTPEAVAFMKSVLMATVAEIVSAEPAAMKILNRFNGVYIRDSTVIGLPEPLLHIWSGCGDSTGETAALKVQVEWELSRGAFTDISLRPGREHDSLILNTCAKLPPGSLNIRDLGYFKLDQLEKEYDENRYWLTRFKTNTVLCDEKGARFDLNDYLKEIPKTVNRAERKVYMGAKHQIDCRLIFARVSPKKATETRRKLKRAAQEHGQTISKKRLELADWVIYVTNVPSEQLSLEEALVLVRVRWQIELLFKLWKSGGQLDKSRSENHWRVLCEIYAKLIGLVIQHWLILVSCWSNTKRSLTKAAQTIRKFAFPLASTIMKTRQLRTIIGSIRRCLANGCRMNTRKTYPNTHQLLANLENDP